MHRALSLAAADLPLVELEAWHASKATLGTDPEVADRLERVADLAGQRGGFLSRASVLAQAAALTPAGETRNARLVGAAEAAVAAGAVQVSKTLLDDVDPASHLAAAARPGDLAAGDPRPVHRRPRARARSGATCSRPPTASTGWTPAPNRRP